MTDRDVSGPNVHWSNELGALKIMHLRFLSPTGQKTTCALCGASSPTISRTLQICSKCIVDEWDRAEPYVLAAHRALREQFAQPTSAPKNPLGTACGGCVNGCRLGPEEVGYCGVRVGTDDGVQPVLGHDKAFVEWYFDPLPTNCVAAHACPGCSGSGYPEYAHTDRKPEVGYKNLAVFYGACTFDCLFCQNWSYRRLLLNGGPVMSAAELASKVDPKTSCICYFGGDPTPQLDHAINTSELALGTAQKNTRLLRVCWETNGAMTRAPLERVAELSLESGGCIKFDLKCYDEHLHIALCGSSNRQTLSNFKWLAKYGSQRSEPPFLYAATLLVPGYVETVQVDKITRFISELDPSIPYSLLAFHPQFKMDDLPITSRALAEECYEIAKANGLERVWIGNEHLLA